MHQVWKVLRTWVCGAAFMVPLLAQAQSAILQRCMADSLNAAQAEARLNWARTCALTLHTGGPGTGFDTGIPSANGPVNLIDYEEIGSWNPSTPNLYFGVYSYGINDTFTSLLYKSGGTSQSMDFYGFYAWSRIASRKKPRPLFPTYGTTSDINSPSGRALFPSPSLNSCQLYYDKAGTQPATGQAFYVNGFCESN